MNGNTVRRSLVLVSLLCVAGCRTTAPQTALVWPEPPAEPRIEYDGAFHGTLDLERSFFGKVRDFLIGPPPAHSLTRPWGVAIDGRGRLLTADPGASAILVADYESGRCYQWHSLGAQGQLLEPINLIVVGDEVFVADVGLGRIVVFSDDGEFSRFLTPEGTLERPVGLGHDASTGEFYVSDTAKHEVLVFDSAGSLLRRWGGRGDEAGQFHYPLGVVLHPNGLVYVVDSLHFAVQAFDKSGIFRFSFGATSDAIGTLVRPRGIDLDSDGNLYVTDAMTHAVHVYDTEGALLLRLGGPGSAPGEFQLPAGIAIDPDNRIHVVDSINQRIQYFRYLPEKHQEVGR